MSKDKDAKKPSREVSRRRFMAESTALLSGALAMGNAAASEVASSAAEGTPVASHIALTVNGVEYRIEVADRLTLAEVLRDQLGFTGVKIGCNRGECGACTVILDGRATYSCSEIAARLGGSKITTVEGLATADGLHPLQQAFLEHDGMQCGFCTPGQIMAAKALLDSNPTPTEFEVRRGLSGNLCRCGCYNHIVAAVIDAAQKLRGKN